MIMPIVIRLAYFAAYAALAALGAALVAGPALLWLRSQGLFEAALAWEVRNGALLVVSAALLAFLTLWLALQAALCRSSRAPLRIRRSAPACGPDPGPARRAPRRGRGAGPWMDRPIRARRGPVQLVARPGPSPGIPAARPDPPAAGACAVRSRRPSARTATRRPTRHHLPVPLPGSPDRLAHRADPRRHFAPSRETTRGHRGSRGHALLARPRSSTARIPERAAGPAEMKPSARSALSAVDLMLRLLNAQDRRALRYRGSSHRAHSSR